MPSEKLRLFVAFDVPMEHRRRIQACVEPLRSLLPGAKWTSVEGQHVTLKFIGWTDDANLGPMKEVVRTVAADHRAAGDDPFGARSVPDVEAGTRLWAGIEDPAGLGSRLAGNLSAALEPLGVEREDRAFTPHLTLARLKTPSRLEEGLLDVALDLSAFGVDEVVLYRSHLSGKGARYEAIERCPLA